MEEPIEVSMNAVGLCLSEASQYNLETEVIVSAFRKMQRDPDTTISEAINHGLNEWVK